MAVPWPRRPRHDGIRRAAGDLRTAHAQRVELRHQQRVSALDGDAPVVIPGAPGATKAFTKAFTAPRMLKEWIYDDGCDEEVRGGGDLNRGK